MWKFAFARSPTIFIGTQLSSIILSATFRSEDLLRAVQQAIHNKIGLLKYSTTSLSYDVIISTSKINHLLNRTIASLECHMIYTLL